jgi:hypothetical protein
MILELHKQLNFMNIKATLFVCTTILMSGWSAVSQATEIKSPNNTGQGANDFHMVFLRNIPDPNPFQSDPWGTPEVKDMSTLVWSGVNIRPGDIFTLKGYTLTKELKNSLLFLVDSFWTDRGDRIGDAVLYSDNNVITHNDLATGEWSLVANPTTVPEPSSILGTLAFSMFGTSVILKQKLKQKKLVELDSIA